jgi:hypothetical protein
MSDRNDWPSAHEQSEADQAWRIHLRNQQEAQRENELVWASLARRDPVIAELIGYSNDPDLCPTCQHEPVGGALLPDAAEDCSCMCHVSEG